MSLKRRAYSLKERYEVVKAVKRGCSKKSAADQLGLPRASVIKMCKNSDKLFKIMKVGVIFRLKGKESIILKM